ncbi:putative low-complexity protein [Mycobacterium sp. JS623]|uniref:pentapeptide repeat-containing protein n=1 Tax=Mycobacterium sp. JS623 TaxID=212767 RepID=UPI0002A5B6F9|nr:pentapeptide repeat-containing protein [Mycobacterium sp. JS623]AGB21684.1 putative low-complexity protein [Mycobacterium sp. JS623]
MAITAAAVGAAFFIAVWQLPLLWSPPLDDNQLKQRTLTDKEWIDVHTARLQVQSANRTAVIQFGGGFVLFSGAVLAWTQFANSRRAARADFHLDLFDKSLTNLGAESSSLRTGGIYALGQLTELSKEHRRVVVEVLINFIRENSSLTDPKPPRPRLGTELLADSGQNLRQWRPDVQAAFDVLGRHTYLWHGIDALRFRGLDLRKVTLLGHRQGYIVSDSDLSGAWLKDADFNGSSFARATFTNADLSGARLDHCNLRGTDFTGARFFRANDDGEVEDLVTIAGAVFDSTTKWPDGWDAAQVTSQGAREVRKDERPTSVRPVGVPKV